MDRPLFVTQTPITTNELNLFFQIDRELFCFLIFKLRRELTQSLLVMALWLWLEKVGYHNLISRVSVQQGMLIDALVNEAVTCLQVLERSDHPIPIGGGLPLTKRLMQKDISLQMFNLKRYTTISGIKIVLNNTCSRIFNDVLQIVLKRQIMIATRGTTSRIHRLNMPLVLPGFPHPLFGTFDLLPRIENIINLSDERIWVQNRPYDDDATKDDRSMFLTFSRGFPVSEMEVRYLFTTNYGDCVQSLTMGGNAVQIEQSLFAIMILKMVEIVDQILNGKRVAKLHINGKHIWARKYEPRV